MNTPHNFHKVTIYQASKPKPNSVQSIDINGVMSSVTNTQAFSVTAKKWCLSPNSGVPFLLVYYTGQSCGLGELNSFTI